MLSVTQTLRAAAQQYRDRPALVFGDRRRSWGVWQQDVARLAAGLQALGLERGGRVAIIAQNSDRYVDALYATGWAGGVVVPVNTRLSAKEIAYILSHADVRLVFADGAMTDLLAAAAAEAGMAPVVIGMEPGDAAHDVAGLIAAHEPVPDAERCDADLSGIFYTGGTTGQSKGVMLSHANHVVHSLAMWHGHGVTAGTMRYLHAAPMFHVADAEFIYGVTVIAGAHYFLPRFEPAGFLNLVAEHRITDTVLVPTMVQMLLDHPGLAGADMSSLARLWYGGSPMPEAVLRRLRDALPGCCPIHLYGQTEAAAIITSLRNEPDLPPAMLRASGRAVHGGEVRIVDEADQALPAGATGEVVCRTGGMMSGYWREEAQSAAALRNGWLHTGDAGYLDENGILFVTDRIKDMIITGGENVFPTEVEQAIYACPGISQCAVIGVPDAQWGERVHAVIVPQPGVVLDTADITARLRAVLAGYKIPRSYEVRGEALPVSGAGKILKRELRKEYAGRMGR